ncbi:MAG: tRNA adenylyl-/cytidylyl-transferase, partial [Candidatus Gottesmanbacteria bacterium GW2011_GWC2_39_8]
MLLGRETKDWDFTTNATPEEILSLFPDSFYDNKFGTVGVPFEKSKIKNQKSKIQFKNQNLKDIFEITTFRSEQGYSDHRHPDKITWGKTVEEDLSRRDFTINAIAYDVKNLIDPFRGQEDIDNKVIKAVGDPSKRFEEDALRIMRAVRLATQLGFIIEPTTFAAIKEKAPQIINVSGERIRDELLKILSSPYPYEGVMMLKNAGLLTRIL